MFRNKVHIFILRSINDSQIAPPVEKGSLKRTCHKVLENKQNRHYNGVLLHKIKKLLLVSQKQTTFNTAPDNIHTYVTCHFQYEKKTKTLLSTAQISQKKTHR